MVICQWKKLWEGDFPCYLLISCLVFGSILQISIVWSVTYTIHFFIDAWTKAVACSVHLCDIYYFPWHHLKKQILQLNVLWVLTCFGSHFQWIRIFCSVALCNGNRVLVAGSNNSRSDRDHFSCSKLCTNWDAGKLHLKVSAILFLSYSQSFGFHFVQFMQEVRMVVSADSVAPAENISPDAEVANDTTTYFMILRILPV